MNIDTEKDFGTRECPACGVNVAENSNRCPICKYEFPNRSPGQEGFRLWVGMLLLIIFILLTFGLLR